MSRKKKKITGNPIDQPSHRNFTMISTTESTAEPAQRMPPYTVHPDSEDYQMEPISNLPQPSSPPSSFEDVEKGRPRGERSPYVTPLKILMGFMLVAGFLLMGLFCLATGVMVRQYPNLQADRSLWFIANLSITLGTFFLVAAIFGFISCFSSKKRFTVIFVVIMIFVVAFHGLAAFRIDQQLGAIQSAGSADWDRLTMPQRLGLQHTFDCCGYATKSDRMVAPCPAKATISCGKKLEGLIGKMGRVTIVYFYINVGIGAFLCILAIIISRLCSK